MKLLLLALLLVAPVAARRAAGLTLVEPQDYQVVQRSSRAEGTVRVRGTFGTAGAPKATLEARIVASGKPGPWQKVPAAVEAAGFVGSLKMPSGGWYRFEVRALVAGKVVGEATVEHVGVGEVFVVAGQSNSANHGQGKQTTRSLRVAAYAGPNWQLANDPQPGASGNGGSFLPPLGDELVARFDVPIGFIACGIGSTSVREWLPRGTKFPNPPSLERRVEPLASGEWASKGEAYEMFIARLNSAGPHGFRAVLWHQGESDANQKDPTRTLPGNLYRDHLERVIRDSRRATGWEAPWFVAQASYHGPGDEAPPEIRAAQASLWRDGLAFEGPDTDALKGDLRERDGRGVHFSDAGLQVHAAKWAEKISPWLAAQFDQ